MKIKDNKLIINIPDGMEIDLPLRVAFLKEIMFLFSMDMTTKITLVTMLRLIMIQIIYIFHVVTFGVIKVMP